MIDDCGFEQIQRDEELAALAEQHAAHIAALTAAHDDEAARLKEQADLELSRVQVDS